MEIEMTKTDLLFYLVFAAAAVVVVLDLLVWRPG
jgi:hypothetical protein